MTHAERIRDILAETGGEVIHPDHYKFRMALRAAILEASDDCSEIFHMTKVKDKDLPRLFREIDALAERLFNRRYFENAA